MWPNPQFPADLVTFTEEILNARHSHTLIDIFWKVIDQDIISGNLFVIISDHLPQFAIMIMSLL